MSDQDLPISSPEDIEKVLTGGVPMGRWKEGLLPKWPLDDALVVPAQQHGPELAVQRGVQGRAGAPRGGR